MIKKIKFKLIIFLIISSIIGVFSIKSLPMFQNINTETNRPKESNVKEQNINDNKSESSQNTTEEAENNISNTLSDNEISSNKKQEKINNDSEEKDNSKPIINNSISNDKKETNNIILEEDFHTTQTKDDNGEEIISSNSIEVQQSNFHYDRTTRIYEDDNITLIRVEYYFNNKLTYYSVVEQFDASTMSYIEKIYKCNLETNIDPLIRIDVYNNGVLTSTY